MAGDVATLRAVPLFAQMSDRELRNVLEISKEVFHAAGSPIVEADQSAIGFHLITDGTAEALVNGATVGTLGPGAYFGEMSLLDGKPRSATVVAVTDLRTLAIPSWNFNQLLDKYPELMRSMLVELCARLRHVEALRS
jgi:CRP/FNR family transcriptional regulator, cyclic AMP receptor protein